jgi:hypothetical protein
MDKVMLSLKLGRNNNGLVGIGFDLIEQSYMRSSVQYQPIQQIIQAIHKPEQGDEHRNAKGYTHCGNERLSPTSNQQGLGNFYKQGNLHDQMPEGLSPLLILYKA